ncbi:MAG: LacI family DNA-binding transcriptional regulator [Acetatifactor sp.]
MVTIKEIAEMAGVSMTTVYNVIHGNVKKVSKANMEKIQALLKEYHYVPKMGLSALKNNRSKIIGVVIHASRYYENTVISDTFYSHVIGALEESMRNAGYYMMLYTAEDLEEIFHMSLAWNVDGLIAITFKYKNYIKLRALTNKPIVAIDLIDGKDGDFINVGLQDEKGGYMMTKYLLECGYQDIYVCSRKNVGVDHERWLGYLRAYKESGQDIKDNHFISLYDTEEERSKNYKMMLKLVNKNTALFFLSDVFAVEGMHYFQSHGVKIPEELGIAGFDDSPLAKYCYPRLTTIRQDMSQKGKAAVKLMIDILEGRLEGNADVHQSVTLVKGSSVRNC